MKELYEENLREIVARCLPNPPESIDAKTRLDENKGDFDEIIEQVEDHYDMFIPEDQKPKLFTFGALVEYVSTIIDDSIDAIDDDFPTIDPTDEDFDGPMKH